MLDRFRFTATLITGGGQDEFFENLPTTETPIPGCLLSPKPKSEFDSLNEKSETYATLFFKAPIDIPKDAQIRTPANSPVEALWMVDGDPIYWPLGVEVNLRKEFSE